MELAQDSDVWREPAVEWSDLQPPDWREITVNDRIAMMQPVVTYYLCVCACVRLLNTTVSPTETAEPIEAPFVVWTSVCPDNYV